MVEMNWYRVVGHKGHVGAKKSEEVILYIQAENIAAALNVYKRVPGIKLSRNSNKKRGRSSTVVFPNMRLLSPEERTELLEEMSRDGRVGSRRVRYYFSREQ